ncbi:MAG: pyridoxal phosphate-dependent aminotransferase [Bacteroidales bacterium]|nr:pyridoxal phosphate-dependent aminotransferase [Bacteroidales bacterium]MBN2758663.1 pyridoxal phosphate-dependent aminotransferase [Bacteroidales bacterium]
MIETKKSGAKYSAIVDISEKLKKLKDEGNDILFLNRGINAVINIDLNDVIPLIDFNSPQIQNYPPNSGKPELKNAINKSFFHNTANIDNIFITSGGMNALDLIFKTIKIEKICVPSFYWGAYLNALKINKVNYDFYESFSYVEKNINNFKNSAVIICDPNNPLGNKITDNEILTFIEKLNKEGIIVIWDSPYRKLFYSWEDDDFLKRLIKFDNVIISESFSKSVGLSGQRLGFVHTTNKEFNQELNINLLYAGNGINAFAQTLVEKLLNTDEGKKAVTDFQNKTISDISKNIKFLIDNNLLVNEFYQNSSPIGIFVIINKSYDELLKYGIGSVPLGYFSQMPKEEANKYSRICVSVPSEDFMRFFNKMI